MKTEFKPKIKPTTQAVRDALLESHYGYNGQNNTAPINKEEHKK